MSHLPVHIGSGQAAVDMADPVPSGENGPVVHPLSLAAEHGLYRGAAPEGGKHAGRPR